MQRSGSIYVVTNTATSEQYVGLTRKAIQKRWDSHKRTAKCKKSKHYKLHIAMQKYGENAFIVQELFIAFDDDALCNAEMQLIADYSPAYNSSLGGAGLRPKEFTDEYRKKRSEAAKSRWSDAKWKAKTIAALQNSHNTDASRIQVQKLIGLRTGALASEETKARISESLKLRNADLVIANEEKTHLIHAKCTGGENVELACSAYGLSKQAFYRYAKRLNLPLVGQKSRRHRYDL